MKHVLMMFFPFIFFSLFCPISCLLALLGTHRLETAPQAHQAEFKNAPGGGGKGQVFGKRTRMETQAQQSLDNSIGVNMNM
ncbi:hypothetical protein V8C34DRAFT_266336, partial [Trichoderma compactum]